MDNGANLFAFDINTGRELWKQNLGTIQKASPVLADGKLYVGSENGKFFILKPGQEKVEILDSASARRQGTDHRLARGIERPRLLVSTDAIYCIGTKKTVTPNPSDEGRRQSPRWAPLSRTCRSYPLKSS